MEMNRSACFAILKTICKLNSLSGLLEREIRSEVSSFSGGQWKLFLRVRFYTKIGNHVTRYSIFFLKNFDFSG